MTDLISRADAIEAVRSYFKDRLGKSKCDYDEELQVYVLGKEERILLTYNKGINDKLRSLPSAELTLQTSQTYGKSINPSNAEVVEDLISRADAIEAVRELSVLVDDKDFSYFEDALNALPSADGVHIETYRELYEKYVELKHASAEAVQGEWKHTITWQPYCSNCEYVFGEDEEFSPFWNYCPMCGARMKGGGDE